MSEWGFMAVGWVLGVVSGVFLVAAIGRAYGMTPEETDRRREDRLRRIGEELKRAQDTPIPPAKKNRTMWHKHDEGKE
jgi:hypothetical protein